MSVIKNLLVFAFIGILFFSTVAEAWAKKKKAPNVNELSEELQTNMSAQDWESVVQTVALFRHYKYNGPDGLLYMEGQAYYHLGRMAGAVIALGDYVQGIDINHPEFETASTLNQKAEQALPSYCTAHARKCGRLGVQTFRRNDESGNRAIAALLFDASCFAGYAKSCNNLGSMYQKGLGTNQDTQKAISLFQIACKKKLASACEKIGTMYEQGDGVEANLEMAIVYYRQFCKFKRAGGCPHLKSLDVEYSQKARPIKRVPPMYPMLALSKKLEGSCKITIDVTAAGEPRNIRPDCTSRLFIKSVKTSVRQWVYEPKIVDGVAVANTDIRISLDFNLAK